MNLMIPELRVAEYRQRARMATQTLIKKLAEERPGQIESVAIEMIALSKGVVLVGLSRRIQVGASSPLGLIMAISAKKSSSSLLLRNS